METIQTAASVVLVGFTTLLYSITGNLG